MTERDGWQQQEGGLWLKVSQFNPNVSGADLSDMQVLNASIQAIAQKHGATVRADSFYHNFYAMKSGGLIADLYLAKWDICEPKAVCLGASYGWENYYFTPNGQLVRSRYTEDVALPRSQLRALVEGKPDGLSFPKKSLAALLENINLAQMAKDGVLYRFGEVDADNTTMRRQLSENEALMGTGNDSAVLQLDDVPFDLMARFLTPVTVVPIMRKGIKDGNNFYVRWRDGASDYRMVVSRGHATTRGRFSPRTDIRTWHNGHLPDQATLESVITASLMAIKQEIEIERKWGVPHQAEYIAPALPLFAGNPELCRKLYPGAGQEILAPSSLHPKSFDPPMPEAHIFVQGDKTSIDALNHIGAQQRIFGNRRMIPGVNVLDYLKVN